MTTPQDPYANPPGWTDPYADLTDISADDPLPPMEPPTTPPAQPPGSPLLTGLIIGLLLIALSVAVFQLLKPDDSGTAVGTSTTTSAGSTTTTSDPSGTTSTSEGSGTTTTIPVTEPYPPVDPPIPVEKLKMITNGMRINDNDIPDITFGSDAATAIGRYVTSFGPSTNDSGWQVSTAAFGVCAGDFERSVYFGTYAAILTKQGGEEIYNGYRQDLTFGSATDAAFDLETLSGLKLGDTVAGLNEIYKGETVSFVVDPKLGDVFRVEGSTSGSLLLWGPIQGENDTDRIVGIYAPDVCNR